MRGSSEITPARDLENRCELERASLALPRDVIEFQEWLNGAINMAMEVSVSLADIKVKEIEYLADVRAAIENLDLARVLR